MSVKEGRIVLPSGMSYRVLVLPSGDAMTPALLTAFEREAAAVVTTIATAGLEMLHEPENDTVEYRG